MSNSKPIFPRNCLAKSNYVDQRLCEMARMRRPGETFSQAAIARFCGVSHTSIQQIERLAKRHFREKMRKALGLSHAEMMEGDV